MKTLSEKLQAGNFIITAEVDPPRGPAIEQVVARARQLAGLVDALNVTDCPMANVRMNSIMASYLIRKATGIETIFHLTCRDRNVIGLQADLLGAAGLGVTNTLVLGGDPPERGNHPSARPVYDVDASGLVRLISALNSGKTLSGTRLDAPTSFTVAVAANPAAADLKREVARLSEKVEAGAHFVQTQPVFDIGTVQVFEAELAAAGLRLPVLYGIMPLHSRDFARKIAGIPGIIIPQRVLDRIEENGDGEGLRMAVELACALSRMVRGIHIFPMGGLVTVRAIASAVRGEDDEWLPSISTAT